MFRTDVVISLLLVIVAVLVVVWRRENPPPTAQPVRESRAPVAMAVDDAPRLEDPGSLRDMRGSRRSLSDFRAERACVLAFLGVECPLANLYVPELIRLYEKYHREGVLFVAVYPHEGETIDRVALHALEHDIPFTVLRDAGQKLADAAGVTRTPEVCVVDGDFRVRYRGRISDQYGVAHRRARATRHDLAAALDELLAGRPVSVPRTTADGCLLNRRAATHVERQVTFCRDVAPILQRRCEICHRSGGQAPFALVDYEEVSNLAEMIREVVHERLMPPWHVVAPVGTFRNDRRLNDDEVQTILAWVDAGRPRGDEADLPEPIVWPDRWEIGKPDVVIECPREFEIPADGIMPYQYAEVPPEVTQKVFAEERWIRAAQALPGNRSVVHHVSIFFSRAGGRLFSQQPDTRDLIGFIGWAPGDPHFEFPPGVGMRVPPATRLEFELHYTPNGRATRDRSSLGLIFWDEPPLREARVACALNTKFVIPPGDPHYRAESTYYVPCDARLLAAGPHMHLRGKAMWLDAVYPDGRRERLFTVPRYDFNWQTWYWFADPPELPEGTQLHSVSYWDNSPQNPFNPDPRVAVRFGEQTDDEMMAPYVVLEVDADEAAVRNVDLFVP